MADSATVEHVDMNIGGDPHAGTDWGKMTPDEQTADVDKLVADVANRREPNPLNTETADADADVTKTPIDGDETPAADDSAPVPAPETVVGGEGEDDGESWLNQDVRDFATAMGLTDEELAEFGSREELDRALRIIDRKAFEAGKVDSQPENPVVQQSEKPKPGEQTQVSGDPLADLSQFMLGEEFDEEAAKPINRFVEAAVATIKDLQNRVAHFERQGQQDAAANIRRQALESLHSLGITELFGKPGEKATKEQVANIEKAIDAHFTHARGLFAIGRQAEPKPEFLRAAVNLAFGDQLFKIKERQLTDKLRKQAARKTGGGGAGKPLPRPPKPGENSRERAERLLADGLQARYDELAEK